MAINFVGKALIATGCAYTLFGSPNEPAPSPAAPTATQTFCDASAPSNPLLWERTPSGEQRITYGAPPGETAIRYDRHTNTCFSVDNTENTVNKNIAPVEPMASL